MSLFRRLLPRIRSERLRLRFSVFLPVLALIGIGFVVLFHGSIPLLTTPDGRFHLHRTRALSEAIAAGVFYPRIFPDFAFDYGYPVFHYYAPFFYYPGALLHWIGVELNAAMLLGLALFLALSAVAMYLFLRCWTTPFIAFVSALLSMFLPYRFYNLFVRGALPEFAAFAWIPLIALGIARLYPLKPLGDHLDGEKVGARANGRNSLLLLLAWFGLTMTHNLSALLLALVFGLFLAVWIVGKSVRLATAHEQASAVGASSIVMTALRVATPALLGVGLAGFYILPALLELEWVGIGQSAGSGGYRNHFATLGSLFTRSFPYAYPPADAPTVAVSGLVLSVILALGLLLISSHDRRLRNGVSISLLISVCALLLMTDVSASLWDTTAVVLGKLQFPWRWQSLLGFSTIWGIGLLLQWLWQHLSRRAAPVFYVLVSLGVVGFIFYTVAALPSATEAHATETPASAELTRDGMWAYDASMGQVGATWTGEFLPRWVEEQRWAIGRAPTDVASANVGPIRMEKGPPGSSNPWITPIRDGYLIHAYDVALNEPTRLIFHTFYFPAWQVTVDGLDAATFPVSNLGLLGVDIPAGKHHVVVRWGATFWMRVGWRVSGIAWFVVLVLLIGRRPRLRPIVYGWLLLALLSIVAFVYPEPTITPTPIGANYDSVRLESAYIQPTKTGASAQVDLTWFLVEPQEPLTVFIHVVGPDGAVIAQEDSPLAGLYTPFERWLPGMVRTRRHLIPLPADLPVGTYRVLAGVYPAAVPGNALAPLPGPDQSSPQFEVDEHQRIPVGSIDIAN